MYRTDASLDDGQTWEDELAVTLTRVEWMSLIPAIVTQCGELRKTAEGMKKASDEGDAIAMQIGPAVAEQADAMVEAMRKICEVVLPTLSEAVRVEAREKRKPKFDA